MNKEKIKKLSGEIFEASLILLLLYYAAFPVKITGESMTDTLNNNDRVVICRTAAMAKLYSVGDIVILNYNAGEDGKIKIVKRIAAAEGDKINISKGKLYINDNLIENYDCPQDEETEILLSADQYFVLGDNPEKSTDSREIGIVDGKNIEGLVLLRFYPFSQIKILKS